MFRTYKYRLYPTTAQKALLHGTLELLRGLYNAALEQRIQAYRRQGVTLNYCSQHKELKTLRAAVPEYKQTHSHLMKDVLLRLHGSYSRFYKRLKLGARPGFPRFKSAGRYRSFTFGDAPARNGVRLLAGGRRLYLSGIGKVKIKLHRPFPGVLKRVSVVLSRDGHWYANFVCADVPMQPRTGAGATVGVDVGITTFATLSTGESVANPRAREVEQDSLRRAQKLVCRRRKGSARRRAAVALLARQHAKITRIRRDFHHKVALDLVCRFDRIHIEALNIQGLAAGRLAKQIHDAGWAQFISILKYKAESAGREVVEVNPRGTSQECSGCGEKVPKKLSVRTHSCPHCGLVLDRDHNAAINILNRLGHSRRGGQDSQPDETKSRSDVKFVATGVVTRWPTTEVTLPE